MARAGSKLARYEEDLLHAKRLPSIEPVELIDSTLEEHYVQQSTIAKRKRLGQFFTPKIIADVMSDWVLDCKPRTILDPAVGTGVLIRTIAKWKTTSMKCDVFDVDREILQFLNTEKPSGMELCMFHSDFLSHTIETRYDGVIMNPPYLRHHDLVYSDSIHEQISELVGAPISRLSNAYVLFVMKACHLLSEGGRGAFIIPSEWTNANFGIQFKAYLLEKAGLKEVIYFTNCSSIFNDSLTTASILLVEKGANSSKITVSCVETKRDIFEEDTVEKVHGKYGANVFSRKQLNAVPKWDSIFRYGQMESIEGFIPLSLLGASKRGIATGANKYFHISENEANALSKYHKKPCVGRATDVKGVVFTSTDYNSLRTKGARIVLIDFDNELSQSDKDYIAEGEAQSLHKRYLLSKRNPWFSMEKREIAPIWAAVFGRKNLRFIHNEAQVYNLTTFHGFYPHNTEDLYLRALVCCLNSKVVQDFAKANMRVYGGGLLKFEPKDILDIQVPDLRKVSKSTIERLSDLLGTKECQEDVDKIVLQAANEATSSNEL